MPFKPFALYYTSVEVVYCPLSVKHVVFKWANIKFTIIPFVKALPFSWRIKISSKIAHNGPDFSCCFFPIIKISNKLTAIIIDHSSFTMHISILELALIHELICDVVFASSWLEAILKLSIINLIGLDKTLDGPTMWEPVMKATKNFHPIGKL